MGNGEDAGELRVVLQGRLVVDEVREGADLLGAIRMHT